jgi:8-oxo-dGTP diphosphatase
MEPVGPVTGAEHVATYLGSKIAVICGNQVLTYLRDDIPTITDPGRWDLPGGFREGDETLVDCAIRETEEEFGITLPAADIAWLTEYPVQGSETDRGAFFVVEVPPELIGAISFGSEGQHWRMMTIDEYCRHDQGVAVLQRALSGYLPAVQG